jgi:hypothetical protein
MCRSMVVPRHASYIASTTVHTDHCINVSCNCRVPWMVLAPCSVMALQSIQHSVIMRSVLYCQGLVRDQLIHATAGDIAAWEKELKVNVHTPMCGPAEPALDARGPLMTITTGLQRRTSWLSCHLLLQDPDAHGGS